MMTERGTRGGPGAAQGDSGGSHQRHIPVLLSEVLEHLRPCAGETYVDATFGAGGYTRAILDAADCRVIAIDRDPAAIAGGEAIKRELGSRLDLIEAPFGELDAIARDAGAAAVDGVVLDLGVSSMQLDEADRGFSFQSDGPLDMRMSQSGRSAADLVATLPEADLADLLFQLGEERRSRAIAKAIVRQRAEKPITTTRDLTNVVARVLGSRPIDGKNPATRTFQALRLAVNDELQQLMAALGAAERLLRPGGRLVVVSFHSLEDRIVKRFLSERSGRTARASRHIPYAEPVRDPSFRIINHRPITPGSEETSANPRARSAKLRAAERTSSPPWPLDEQALGLPQISRHL